VFVGSVDPWVTTNASGLMAVVEVVVVVASVSVAVVSSGLAAVLVVRLYLAWVTDVVVPSGLATALVGVIAVKVKFVVVDLTVTVVA
jgi:hypothetical protein